VGSGCRRALMRPPLGLEAFQLSVALQRVDGPLQSRPQVVAVDVLSRVLLDGERVLVAVEVRAEHERVEVARLLLHPVLGGARVDHESVFAVALAHLAHAVGRRQRKLTLVHLVVHLLYCRYRHTEKFIHRKHVSK